MKRLFVGIPVSEEVKQKIKPILKQLNETGAQLNLVPLENLHFTVKFLGEAEESKIAEIKEKLQEIAKTNKPFKVKLKSVGVFPSKKFIRVVWIGTESPEMISLIKQTEAALSYIRKNEYKEEVPHLTLARVRMPNQKLLDFLDKTKFEEEMDVKEMILFESKLSNKGTVYEAVSKFKLMY